jgi:hypothetical protein
MESRNSAHEKVIARKVHSINLLWVCFDPGIYQSPAGWKLTSIVLLFDRIVYLCRKMSAALLSENAKEQDLGGHHYSLPTYLHILKVFFVRVIPTRNDPLFKTWGPLFIGMVSS